MGQASPAICQGTQGDGALGSTARHGGDRCRRMNAHGIAGWLLPWPAFWCSCSTFLAAASAAGLVLGLVTFFLSGKLLVWLLCEGRGGVAESAEVLGTRATAHDIGDGGVLDRAEDAIVHAGNASPRAPSRPWKRAARPCTTCARKCAKTARRCGASAMMTMTMTMTGMMIW